MGLTGDFAGLTRVIRRLIKAQGEKAAREIARSIADYSEIQTLRAFRAQQSPEGEQWAEGSFTSKPMLSKTGKMRGSYVSRVSGLTYTLRNKARYAHYHQSGAVLRDSIQGSRGRLKSQRGPGKGKFGMRSRPMQGPKRKGRERGFLPQRPIMPFADRIPPKWEAGYRERGDRVLSRLLGS